jgi:transposase
VVSRMPCRLAGLASERAGHRSGPCHGVARNRIGTPPHQVCPPWHTNHDEEEDSYVRDRDHPHRGSHAAAVLDGDERVRAVLHLPADRQQRQRLLSWATGFMPRRWAVEGATGTGALLAQQLVAAGEQVLDVPPKLAARVRLLDNNHSDKTDSHDARSTAIVALRNARLRQVGLEDHTAVLRLLAKRHHDLIAARTRAMCRLHTTVCFLIEGHLPRRLRAERAARILAGIRPTTAIDVERKALAHDLLAEVRRHDRELAEHLSRVREAVAASGTTFTALYGVGPIVAAYVLGYSGDICRFPSAGHYARYNATAPIEASSGPVIRHRLNPRGNRQLNHAIHIIAVTQVRNDTPGRGYYLRKPAEGHSRKEAMRALKRRISDVVYRQLSSTTTADQRAREDTRERLQWPA